MKVPVSFPANSIEDAENICAEMHIQYVRAMPLSKHDHSPNHKGRVHGGQFACYAICDSEPSELVAAIEGIVIHTEGAYDNDAKPA